MRAVPVLFMVLATACDDPGPPVPASLAVFPDSLSFASLADTARLVTTVRDENGEVVQGADVAWSSRDAEVARVGPLGLVTSVADGRTVVTATAGSASAAASVQVRQVAATVRIHAPLDSLTVGDSVRMTAQASDAAGSEVVGALFSWRSSDPAIATVADGWVRARAPGSAVITATLGELAASAALVSLPLSERRVLEAIYEAGGGALWKDNTNWLTDTPLAEWYGVRLNDDGQVAHLLLTDNGLIGTIPPEVASLGHLESLHLGLNNLGGSLPPEIAYLKRLRSLELTYNAHTGPIPPEIGGLESLEWLGAFGNRFTGEIPPEIGDLTQLESLDLCYNRLTGPIPPEIGNLTNLRRLALCGIDADPTEGNRLSGPIPPEIGNLSELSLLSLGANRLSGPIPPEIGRLQNLRSLNVGWGWASGRNLITGPIPPEIGNLARLERLDLGGNRLTGSIPPEIGGLRSLTNLELGSNNLEGAIPGEVGKLTRLTSLAVCKNNLEGPVPAELGNLTRLTHLFLCTNRLSGPVPQDLGDLQILRRLIIAGNRLTSAVPASMISLRRLEEFYWQNNDGLCVPVLEEFDDWLSRIPARHGDRCPQASGAARTGNTAVVIDFDGGPNRHVTEVRPLVRR